VRRAWWLLIVGVVVAGIVLLGVFPARTYFAQRRDLDATEARLEVLSQQNKALARQAARLHTDEEIERLAREQYNLVKPGEEAYAILPSPEPEEPVAVPEPAPVEEKQGFWTRVGDTITFWN
jgi:cell division protein FtsB